MIKPTICEIIAVIVLLFWFAVIWSEIENNYFQCETDTQCEFLHPWGVD